MYVYTANYNTRVLILRFVWDGKLIFYISTKYLISLDRNILTNAIEGLENNFPGGIYHTMMTYTLKYTNKSIPLTGWSSSHKLRH